MVDSKSNISGWSLDEGYKDQSKVETYPIRAFGSNKNSLDVSLKRMAISDFVCSSIYNLLTVTLSMPGENILPFFSDSVKGME